MPVLNIPYPELRLNKVDFKSSSVSKWKDGETLFTNSEDAANEEIGYFAIDNEGGNAHEENLKKAQETISTMIEPQVLITVPAPKVVVHKRLKGEPGFRAYQGGTEVHIASDDAVETIVHEVGHYLESNLGSKLYHDVGC